MAEGQADRRVMWTLAVQMDPGTRETIDQFIAQLERIPGRTTVSIGTGAGGGYATTPQQSYTGSSSAPTVAARGGAGVVAGTSGAGYSTTYPTPPPPGSTLSPNPRASVSEGSRPSQGGRRVEEVRAGGVRQWAVFNADNSLHSMHGRPEDARRASADQPSGGESRAYTGDPGVGFGGRPRARNPVLDVPGAGGSDQFGLEGKYRPALLSDWRRMERTHKEEDKQDSSYENRFVRERDTATRRAMGTAERQGRFGETAEARRDRETAESRRQYDLGNITAQQHLGARVGIQRQYDTRQAQERNRLEHEYFSTQQRIESAHASIHRQMSYASMAAMELGRGFGYIGAMAGKSTEQILKILATVEAVFAIGRGVTLGMSAFENIAKQRKLIERASVGATGGGTGALTSTMRAEGLAGTVAGGVSTGMEPAAAGAGWVAGGGGLGNAVSPAAMGMGGIAAGTIAMIAGGAAFSSWSERALAPRTGTPLPQFDSGKSQGTPFSTWGGTRVSGMWERRARGFDARRAQAEETEMIYAARQAQYERATTISEREASTTARERGVGGLPGPLAMQRPIAEAELGLSEARAREADVQRRLKDAEEGQAKIDRWGKEAADENVLRAAELKKLEERKRRERSSQITSAGSGGLAGAATRSDTLSGEEERRMRLLQNLPALVGGSANEIKEAATRLANEQNNAAQATKETAGQTRKVIEAQSDYHQSLLMAAQRHADEAGAGALGAGRRGVSLATHLGGMTEGESAQFDIAAGMVRSGTSPRMIPPAFKAMIRNSGDEELIRMLDESEAAVGRQRGAGTKYGRLEGRKQEIYNLQQAEALGLNPEDVPDDPNIWQRLGINPKNAADSPEFLRRRGRLQAFGLKEGVFGEDPSTLALQRDNPASRRSAWLSLQGIGAQLGARGMEPEAVGMTPDMVGGRNLNVAPGALANMPTVLGELSTVLKLDADLRKQSVAGEQALTGALTRLSQAMEKLESQGIKLQLQEDADNKHTGRPAGAPPLNIKPITQAAN